MELINIIENRGRQLVSARELYEFLGLSRRFSLWIEIYIKEDNEYDFVKGRYVTSVRQRTLVNLHQKANYYSHIIIICFFYLSNNVSI